MWHRIVVKLSFARAKGRNYRQLPAKARLRENPRLPISSALRDTAFPSLHVSGEMFFPAREYRPRGYLGSSRCKLGGKLAVGHPAFCCRYGRTIASRLVEMTILFEGEFNISTKGPRNCGSFHGKPEQAGQVGFASFDSPGQVIFVFGFAARKREQRKGLRPVSFNPCSAPVTPAQTWGTPPGGTERCRILGFNLKKGTAGRLTIQTVAPTAR
ncbi:MAG: hypothetical protein QOJ51_5249 [Acidobacteriaceae bacterium]|nr:hypothetical protein [Acidobacteriaceae bacterium]